jgi:hypothetical protein
MPTIQRNLEFFRTRLVHHSIEKLLDLIKSAGLSYEIKDGILTVEIGEYEQKSRNYTHLVKLANQRRKTPYTLPDRSDQRPTEPVELQAEIESTPSNVKSAPKGRKTTWTKLSKEG